MTRALLPVLVLVHAAAACGDGGDRPRAPEEIAGTPASGRAVIQVRLTDRGIVPDTLRMAVGDTVRLAVANETDQPLEFLMGRQPGASTFQTPFFADVRMLGMEGPIVAAETPTGTGRPARPGGEMRHPQVYFYLQPGEDGSVTFIVPPDRAGVWGMACFLEGHAREGLRGVVIVGPPTTR